MGWGRAAVAGSLLMLVATPARAAACDPGAGTTVVVDFGSLGGGVVAGCAPTAGTGFEALTEAGFEVTRVQSGAAFICRIDGLPGPGTEDCADTPPADAFWSYWTADFGGGWRFNSRGAAGAIPGDLEGWAFATSSTDPPAFSVPPPPTTSSTTTSTTTTSATTTSTTPASTTTTSTTTSTTSTTAPPDPTSTSTTTTSTTPTSTSTAPSSTTSSTTTTALPPSTTTTALIAAAADSSGGAGGFVAGGVVIVAVAAGAGWVAWRRREGAT